MLIIEVSGVSVAQEVEQVVGETDDQCFPRLKTPKTDQQLAPSVTHEVAGRCIRYKNDAYKPPLLFWWKLGHVKLKKGKDKIMIVMAADSLTYNNHSFATLGKL